MENIHTELPEYWHTTAKSSERRTKHFMPFFSELTVYLHE